MQKEIKNLCFLRDPNYNDFLPGTMKGPGSPPKLYTFGGAKSIQTTKQKYLGIKLEIVPVKVIYNE